MKFIIVLITILAITGCSSVPQKTAHNPDGMRDDELVKVQMDKLAKLERDMERRENELKYQHLKELQTLSAQAKTPTVVNTSCKFFCF
ncbi:hypothetical protein MCEMSE6_02797 [Oxalobacteraceae bacterium]